MVIKLDSLNFLYVIPVTMHLNLSRIFSFTKLISYPGISFSSKSYHNVSIFKYMVNAFSSIFGYFEEFLSITNFVFLSLILALNSF